MKNSYATASRGGFARLPKARAGGILAGIAAAAFLTLGCAGAAHAAYNFLTIDNPADVNFNQLLGINNNLEIVGYDGDGVQKPNKGYNLFPRDHFSSENYPDSVQTQVIGINNIIPKAFPFAFTYTVGFWIDTHGNNHGFANVNGEFFTVDNPNAGVSGGIKTNQLLGVNDHYIGVGFYLDAKGNSHGYTYNFANEKFTPITLPAAFGAVSVTSAGINDADIVCGSYVDGAGNTHGFYGKPGSYVSVNAPGSTGTVFFGLNNKDMLVGFETQAGVSHGLIYNSSSKVSTIVDDPKQSSQPAFNVTGTTINGINDYNEIVGFYSDGEQVHGFLAAP